LPNEDYLRERYKRNQQIKEYVALKEQIASESYSKSYRYTSDVASPEHVVFKDAAKLFFRNYGNFSGRSTRSEFWNGILLSVLLTGSFMLCSKLFLADFLRSPLYSIFFIFMLIPVISLLTRRFHDTGRSASKFLIALLIAVAAPIGILAFMQMLCLAVIFGFCFEILSFLQGTSVDIGTLDLSAFEGSDNIFLFLILICIAAFIILILYAFVISCIPGEECHNKYGRAPF
jgi:uncharacterized membrane protein YhaH (DUF805 family)